MTFSERELWIFIMTTMHTSSMAKQAGKITRQAIEEHLRKKICPSIDYKEWLAIENDIVTNRNMVMDTLMQGTLGSLGVGREAFENQADFKEMDEKVQGETQRLLELIKNNMPEENIPQFEKALDELKKTGKVQ